MLVIANLQFSNSSRFVVAVLLHVIFGCSIVNGQDGNDGISREKRLDAGSLFDAVFSNALAIEKGDFLMKVTKSFDSNKFDPTRSDELIFETVTFHRFVFDHVEKRYFYVRRMQAFELIVLSDKEPRESSVQSTSGFMYDKGVAKSRVLPQVLLEHAQVILPADLFRIYSVPDLRGVGLVTFGGARPLEMVERAVDRMTSGSQVSKVVQIGKDRQKIELTVKNARSERVNFIEVVLDTLALLPESRKIYARTKAGERSLLSEEKFSWEKHNGVNFPFMIEKRNTSMKKVADKSFFGFVETEAKIHWFSKNQPLDEKVFDFENLSDTTLMIRISDPVATKAGGFIDESIKQSKEDVNSGSGTKKKKKNNRKAPDHR